MSESGFLCLRVDLDYVPWDTPDARDFGHGEPAVLLRMLELVRGSGAKLHFFASNRTLRAFPAVAEAVLNDGHDFDWLSKHPGNVRRFEEAIELFGMHGHTCVGLAVRGAWPEGVPTPEGVHFVSAETYHGSARFFPTVLPSDRDAIRGGSSFERWVESCRRAIREGAARRQEVTLCVRPQALAAHDRRLERFAELASLAQAVGLPLRTLRDVVRRPAPG